MEVRILEHTGMFLEREISLTHMNISLFDRHLNCRCDGALYHNISRSRDIRSEISSVFLAPAPLVYPMDASASPKSIILAGLDRRGTIGMGYLGAVTSAL